MIERIRKVLFILSLVVIILVIGCSKNAEKQETMSQVTGSSVQELKATACGSAQDAGTCDTRLPELGFVTKEECCELFKKCC
jgi:hypothetical protein